MATEPHADYPWRLRIVHEGCASLRVERRGLWFRFDPIEVPGPGEAAIVTWTEWERAKGVLAAIAAGSRPTLIATPPVRMWLSSKGEVDDRSLGGKVDGVLVEAMEYQPIPYATPPEAVRKAKAAILNPAMAVQRLRRRMDQPSALPVIVQLSFPDGGRLLHMNCALHNDTDAEWLKRVQDRFRSPDWLIVGMDYEHEAAAVEGIPGFEAKTVLVTDLVNDVRRAIGLPCGILTPHVDALKGLGIDAHPFVKEAGFRFE